MISHPMMGMNARIMFKTHTTTATAVRKIDCQEWKRTLALAL